MVFLAAPLPRVMEKPSLLLSTFSPAREALLPKAVRRQPPAASRVTEATRTAP